MPHKKDYWHLEEILNLEQLKKLFKHFSVVTGLDAGLFDFAGNEVLVNRKENSVCAAAKNGPLCRERISYGGLMSSELGEPYISACACGLIMCYLPIMFKEHLIGSIACGPVLLWDADDVAKEEFLEKTRPMNIKVDVNGLFSSISSCGCINMTSAAQILFIIVNSLTREHSVYLEQRAVITDQQAKIASLIIERKNASAKKPLPRGPSYPAEKEQELMGLVQGGSLEQSRKALDGLLGEIFLYADGNMDNIRARLFELIAFFSRAAVETGAPLQEINHITEGSFEIFSGATDFERVCYLTRTAMEEFIHKVFKNHGKKQLSDHLGKAVSYIERNYSGDLTLQRVADAIFVSAFYLSHLFRNEMNTTFSDYVCLRRINRAKEFLKTSKFMRIREVAEKTGFNDPNYFAKSFKRLVGVTPKEYRAFFF